jgi:glutamate synthase (NADPH/NADH) small chain
MGDIKGFIKYEREVAPERLVADRVEDWKEIPTQPSSDALRRQGARCMDCGIPFCHTGCPLGNIIPDFNDLVWRNQWREANAVLHATNNFPEFTGRICPAPCESACVLGITNPPVTIKQIEKAIVDRAWEEDWIVPRPPTRRTGKQVAVIGSGPAGLAAAQQLNWAGHGVTLFERADRLGGLLTYGIPDFKLEKLLVERRIEQMRAEGVQFKTGVWVGRDYPTDQLLAEFDAVCLTGGATKPRDFPLPGRDLQGAHFAMDFLTQQNRRNAGDTIGESEAILAVDKHVIVIGGGDTGSDCVGTSVRQGARSVTQIELLDQPPEERPERQPWPYYPMIMRTSTSQAEGCNRKWSILTKSLEGDDQGRVRRLGGVRLEWTTANGSGPMRMQEIPGSEFTLDADLVLLAMGFTGPERTGLIDELGVAVDERGNVEADHNYMTSRDGVFAAGDLRRGQSLVVWALAEGREAARGIDLFLMGESQLPTVNTRGESLPRR